MKQLSLYVRILMIFFLPTIALLYFSVSFLEEKYQQLHESSMYKLSAETTGALSSLIHTVQIERGLSFGYLVSNRESTTLRRIAAAQKNTDHAYESVRYFIRMNSREKEAIFRIAGAENGAILSTVTEQYGKLKTIRQRILQGKIGVKASFDYYTLFNRNLIDLISLFVLPLQKENGRRCAMPELQKLKEYTGLERAHMYHVLLSGKYSEESDRKIRALEEKQAFYRKAFLFNAPKTTLKIFRKFDEPAITKQLESVRKNFFFHALTAEDAPVLFQLFSRQIDRYEKIASKILDLYIASANTIYTQAMHSLYLSALLWILSLLSLAGLAYLLRKMTKNESQYMDELRIAAYTFDSHEAMTITDIHGTILKVNRAFTRITGYQSSEVIGKNPSILKSMRHSEAFYREMWQKINQEGKWSGEIYNKRKNGEIYMERLSITAIKNEKGVTTHYIAQFLDISDIKKMQEYAQHQADHDFLTGLLNRKALMQRLQEEFIKAKRHGFVHAFMFIDLDKFKMVNDNYGHAVGDKLLIEVAKRLKGLLREEDIVARMSGDEFAILVLNLEASSAKVAQQLQEIAEKVIAEINRPSLIDGYQVQIGASVGIKIFPEKEKNIQAIIRHADTAMYQAKHQGKNRFLFFDQEIEAKLHYFQKLETSLQQAIAQDEFVFYYQPKIELATERIVGAEALIRWQHPEKGLLYPDAFLQIASEIGLSHKITTLVLTRVCRFLQQHHRLFEGSIAVNIHANELLEVGFEERLMEIVKHHGVDPSRIELEITEDELIRDFQAIVARMQRLKVFGIRFAIDDFGTGYSSITYLQKLPIDTLKIDKAFLDNVESQSGQELLRLIINMAKTFHLSTVTEGVETQSQLAFIKEHHVDMYQGYLFSRAVEESRFLSLLHRQG